MTISAKMIADSVSPHGVRISTMQLRYPRFIHAEFMTHRQFSRNASSSRAIPVKRLIEDIERDVVMPSYWGKNQKGMQAEEEHIAEVEVRLGEYGSPPAAWRAAAQRAIHAAKAFDAAGYHKQIVNRLLEPFSHINVVVTSTEWSNFYALRRHPDAQPEIQALAEAMHDEHADSFPNQLEFDEWHLPYVTGNDWRLLTGDFAAVGFKEEDECLQKLIKISVARCARVSYLTMDGKEPNIEADLQLYERLVGSHPMHASPAEHQATPDRHPYTGASIRIDHQNWMKPHEHGNFVGWRQYRKMLPGECQ